MREKGTRSKKSNLIFLSKNIFSTGWCFWPVLNVWFSTGQPVWPVLNTSVFSTDWAVPDGEPVLSGGSRPVLIACSLAVASSLMTFQKKIGFETKEVDTDHTNDMRHRSRKYELRIATAPPLVVALARGRDRIHLQKRKGMGRLDGGRDEV